MLSVVFAAWLVAAAQLFWGPSRVSFMPRPVCMRLVGLIHIWVPTLMHAIHVLRVEGS